MPWDLGRLAVDELDAACAYVDDIERQNGGG